MKNETHKDRLKILSEAPVDGTATHFTQGRTVTSYFKWKGLDQYFKYNKNKEWTDIFRPVSIIRSLADIQKLVDMQNEIDVLELNYAEVERERIKLAVFKRDIHPLIVELSNTSSNNGLVNFFHQNENYHNNMEDLNDSQKLIIEIKNRISKYD